jgi:type VI secretion system secreted protein Hcp
MPLNDIHIRSMASRASPRPNHRDEIVVESWNWGVANPAPVTPGGGAAAGRASFADFTFTHRVDRASPLLWKAVHGQAIGRRRFPSRVRKPPRRTT